jgi:hypothetical protein
VVLVASSLLAALFPQHERFLLFIYAAILVPLLGKFLSTLLGS